MAKSFRVIADEDVMKKIPRDVNLSALMRSLVAAGFLASMKDWNAYLASHPEEEKAFDEFVERTKSKFLAKCK